MSFELVRHSVDRSMTLNGKVIGYKKRTISESLYDDELVKNLTMEICCEATNINHNIIYIPIYICFEGYNRYELCIYIDSGCSICFEKKINIFRIYMKKAKNFVKVKITNNNIMSHNETIEGLFIEIVVGTKKKVPSHKNNLI